MAAKTYLVPSLFTRSNWKIDITKPTTWKFDTQQWEDDRLINHDVGKHEWAFGATPGTGNPGLPFGLPVEKFIVRLARTRSHHDQLRDNDSIANLGVYNAWAYTPARKLECGSVFAATSGVPWLCLIPGTSNLGPHDIVTAQFGSALASATFAKAGGPARMPAFTHRLQEKLDVIEPWYVLEGGGDQTPQLGFDQINHAVRESRGTLTASLPFHGAVPTFRGEGIEMLSLSQLDDRSTIDTRAWRAKLTRVVPARAAKGKEVIADLNWFYPYRDAPHDNRLTGFALRGKLDKANFSGEFQHDWTPNNPEALVRIIETLQSFVEKEAASAEPKRGPYLPEVVSLKLVDCEVVHETDLQGKPIEAPWIRLGSIEIQPVSGPATVDFSLRGEIGTGASAVYPTCDINNITCNVRSASGSDPIVQWSRLDESDDPLPRESAPIVSVAGKMHRGTLRLKTRYEGGRHATTELRIEVEGDLDPGSALWLNLRPFLVAKIGLPRSRSKDKLLLWRSDDPQGAQWRVDDPEVKVVLPPQAIGEAMERGSRFYDAGQGSPIDANAPVQYRFSRPTYLTLLPSPPEENRRFEKPSLNFREIVRGAIVREMTVEMAYPLEVAYRATPQRTIKLTEVGEFFGQPSEMVETTADSLKEGRRLSAGVRSYLEHHPGEIPAYGTAVVKIMGAQEVAWHNYVSRLAELYIHDPTKPRAEMRLTEGLTSRLRGRGQGAAPLADPLPKDAVFDPSLPLGRFQEFLENRDWAKAGKGSLRGGLIHSFEFQSELVEVLDAPEAVDTVIETLCLSALGATGKMEASFANGKTTFAVTAAHGQLSRLVKTRIGRIGALWNRAKHVVVYERTTTLSAQFENEQTGTLAFNGWPILRKTEEYIDPIQVERVFEYEEGSGENATGFIRSSLFATQRIYVNGAWARDIGDGYELPLWDPRAAAVDPKFYPKPHICLECHGEEGKFSRLWFAQPQYLYFHSSSAPGTGVDTDKWKARSGVDFEEFLPRWPAPQRSAAQASLPPSKPANPQLCLSSRFDLAVDAEGPVNLQHERGKTPMLVQLQRVSISRTAQKSPQLDIPQPLKKAGEIIELTADLEQGATAAPAAIDELRKGIEDLIDKKLYADPNFDCKDIEQEVFKFIDGQMVRVRKGLNPLRTVNLKGQLQRGHDMWMRASSELTGEILRRGTIAEGVLKERVRIGREAVDAVKKEVVAWPASLDAAQRKRLESLATDIHVLADDIDNRAKAALMQGPADIQAALDEAVNALATALAKLNQSGVSLKDRCAQAEEALSSAIAKLDAMPASARKVLDPCGQWVKTLSGALRATSSAADYVESLSAVVAAQLERAVKDSVAAVTQLADVLATWSRQQLTAAANAVATQLGGVASDLSTKLQAIASSTTQDAAIAAVTDLQALMADAETGVLGACGKARAKLENAFAGVDKLVADAFAAAQGPIKAVSDAAQAFTATMDSVANEIEAKLKNIVSHAAGACTAMLADIRRATDEAIAWAKQQADGVISDVLSSEAARQVEHVAASAQKAYDVGSQAISLARALGDLPKMTPLEFDINAADYVFDGKLPTIRMSPAVARLQQQGEKLLESLGISVPCDSLLDQLVPNIKEDVFGFNDIFQKFAGMDFEGLFKRFRLPELNSSNVAVRHGFDKKTRRAWVDTTVAFSHPEYEELFGFGPVALGLEKMKFDAFSGIETSFDGLTPRPPVAKTHASLLGDWSLLGGGQRVVTFHNVAITFDGASGFDFSVSPDDIELHPALKFVSEFVQQFKKNLPPAVEIVEENGRPIGVRAGTTIVLDDLPDLGAVKIGPIDMRSSLGLIIDRGRFKINSAFSLGNKQLPIFVQITWLGGGCWVETQATYVDGDVQPSLSVGLSVGATRGFNLASVAIGSFSVMLYCYIELRRGSDSIAIGLSITGSALIIGFVNASLSLLLEAQHSGGQTTGTGRLDVSVKISWVYTFRYKTSVKHKF